MVKILVSSGCVALFNAQWPGSPLDARRHYWFEFDDSENLIDCDVPEHSDGPAAVAVAEDCRAFAFDGVVPDWAASDICLREI